MYLSSRLKKILLLLLNARQALTIHQIACQLQLSERTVYRELATVRQVIEKQNLELITIPQRGLIVQGKQSVIAQLIRNISQNKVVQDYLATERIDLTMLYLLVSSDYIKQKTIALALNVSVSTVKKDLPQVRIQLQHWNLQLISKKSEGLFVKGFIYQRQIAMMNLLVKDSQTTELLHWLQGQGPADNSFLNLMSQTFGKLFTHVYTVVMPILQQEQVQVSDSELIEFVILVGLWFNSWQQQQAIIFQESIAPLTKKTQQIDTLLQQNLVHGHLDHNYQDYLRWLIQIYFGEKDLVTSWDGQAMLIKSDLLVQKVEERLGISLSNDNDLLRGLQRHLNKAVNRIESGITIRNPLTKEIQANYSTIYTIVAAATRQLFGAQYFPADEIGYLVMYFAIALDKLVQRSFNVLIVCSSGMGSAKMLASRVEREIPEITVKKVTSIIEMEHLDLTQFDLILSTVPLEIKGHDLLRVSPLLSTVEKELIERKVEAHKYRSLSHTQNPMQKNPDRRDALTILTEMTTILKSVTKLLRELEVSKITITQGERLQTQIISYLQRHAGLNSQEVQQLSYNWSKNFYRLPEQNIAILNCPLPTKRNSKIFILKIQNQSDCCALNKLQILTFCHGPMMVASMTSVLSKVIIHLSTSNKTQAAIENANKEQIRAYLSETFKRSFEEIF